MECDIYINYGFYSCDIPFLFFSSVSGGSTGMDTSEMTPGLSSHVLADALPSDIMLQDVQSILNPNKVDNVLTWL